MMSPYAAPSTGPLSDDTSIDVADTCVTVPTRRESAALAANALSGASQNAFLPNLFARLLWIASVVQTDFNELGDG
jgi:hypothetical protein